MVLAIHGWRQYPMVFFTMIITSLIKIIALDVAHLVFTQYILLVGYVGNHINLVLITKKKDRGKERMRN